MDLFQEFTKSTHSMAIEDTGPNPGTGDDGEPLQVWWYVQDKGAVAYGPSKERKREYSG
jgi:hypothetical protein